jgi:PiT family inorganic phosphate transporter
LEPLLLQLSIALALIFAFLNGYHEGSNVVATSILSRSLTPGKALLVASLAELGGAVLLGSAVARAIGELMAPVLFRPGVQLASSLILFSSLCGMIVWTPMASWVGIPPSSSHSLLGGLLGGALAAAGIREINWSLMLKFAFILLAAPPAGALAGALLRRVPFFRGGREDDALDPFFKWSRIAGLIVIGMSHGTNNAQKAAALAAIALVSLGSLEPIEVPLWISLACGSSLALGIYLGGWNIVRILGNRIFSIKPIHSFRSQAATGFVLLAATIAGGPVNGVEVIKSAVVGVGAGKRTRNTYRGLYRDILMAWTMTLPATAVLAAATYWISAGALGMGMGSFETLMKSLGQ